MSENKTWSLDNAHERAKEAPYTFYLPSQKVLSSLKPEDVVKLVFNCDIENENGYSAERMWVLIKKIEANIFWGELNNNPSYIPDLKVGDLIQFHDFNIIDTEYKDPESNLDERYWERCYVTSQVLKEKKPVKYLLREKPEEKEKDYSGWTLFSGQESEAYLDSSENWNYVALGAVLNINDNFINLLDSPIGAEYAYDDNTNQFSELS